MVYRVVIVVTGYRFHRTKTVKLNHYIANFISETTTFAAEALYKICAWNNYNFLR